jgi:hypothetical protein
MTAKRPITIRPALALTSGPDVIDPARAEREHENAAVEWLYAWSHDALRPTGELLAARLSTPVALRPGRRVGRIPRRSRRRQSSPELGRCRKA